MHFQSAGDREGTSRHALIAAEHASAALAFDRAARFYQLALDEGVWERAELVNLRRKLAGALVHAGRGLQAARAYLDASRDAHSSVGFELRRLAAEQLLRSGHTEEGLEVLRAIARDLGIWLPEKPWQAMGSLLWHRFRTAFHPLRFRERPSIDVREKDLMVLDVYWSLVIGLGVVDLLRGSDFQARHLLLALRVGERTRVAMSLATYAGFLSASNGRHLGRSRELLAKARELAEGTDHPHVLGLIATMEVVSAVFAAKWSDALRLSDHAEFILREKCTGAAWERGTNTGLALAAAILLGQWSKVLDHTQRLPNLMEQARARGDIFTIHHLLQGAHLARLASDHVESAHEVLRETELHLPPKGFYIPHFMLMVGKINTALYEGKPSLALEAINATWPALSKSFLLRSQYFVINASHFRAQASLAQAASVERDRRKHLQQATRLARRIERQRVPWGNAIAVLIRASISSIGGNHQQTLVLLAKAEAALNAADMSHLVAACRYRRGCLLGGAEGQNLVGAAKEWAKKERVTNPARMFDMLVPGRW
jgi:hypothetical protein